VYLPARYTERPPGDTATARADSVSPIDDSSTTSKPFADGA